MTYQVATQTEVCIHLEAYPVISEQIAERELKYKNEYGMYRESVLNPMPYQLWSRVYEGYIALSDESRELMVTVARHNFRINTKAISELLHVTAEAINKRKAAIKQRMNAANLQEAVVLACQAGLIVPVYQERTRRN